MCKDMMWQTYSTCLLLISCLLSPLCPYMGVVKILRTYTHTEKIKTEDPITVTTAGSPE